MKVETLQKADKAISTIGNIITIGIIVYKVIIKKK